jgi:hypothetical protein
MALDPARASFRFYAELNDHLPPGQQYRTVERDFVVPASVKDMIESFGVPRTEVELVVVNGESSDFSRLVQNGDRVAVYPVFESLDITPELRLRPQALRDPKFVLDVLYVDKTPWSRGINDLGFRVIVLPRPRYAMLKRVISCPNSSSPCLRYSASSFEVEATLLLKSSPCDSRSPCSNASDRDQY